MSNFTFSPKAGAVIDPSYTKVSSGITSVKNSDCIKNDFPAPYGPVTYMHLLKSLFIIVLS